MDQDRIQKALIVQSVARRWLVLRKLGRRRRLEQKAEVLLATLKRRIVDKNNAAQTNNNGGPGIDPLADLDLAPGGGGGGGPRMYTFTDLDLPPGDASEKRQFPLGLALCSNTLNNEKTYMGPLTRLFKLIKETQAHIILNNFDTLHNETFSDLGPFAGFTCDKQDFKVRVMMALKYWAEHPPLANYPDLSLAQDLYKEHISHHPPTEQHASNRLVVEPFICVDSNENDEMAEELREEERRKKKVWDKKWEKVDDWDTPSEDHRMEALVRQVAELTGNSVQTYQMVSLHWTHPLCGSFYLNSLRSYI